MNNQQMIAWLLQNGFDSYEAIGHAVGVTRERIRQIHQSKKPGGGKTQVSLQRLIFLTLVRPEIIESTVRLIGDYPELAHTMSVEVNTVFMQFIDKARVAVERGSDDPH